MMPTQILFIHIIELLAALAGSYYLLKTNDKLIRPFGRYLWLIVFVETLGLYGYVLQNNYDYDWYIWLKNSVWCTNSWLYSIFEVVTIAFFLYFYRLVIKDPKVKKALSVFFIGYLIFTILYFIFTDDFYSMTFQYNTFISTFFIVFAVSCYYRELLKSEQVLYFYKDPIFYISTGLFIWHLCYIPLAIFNDYFRLINNRFIQFRYNYMLIINLFLYLCYTFGFLYTLRFRKQ